MKGTALAIFVLFLALPTCVSAQEAPPEGSTEATPAETTPAETPAVTTQLRPASVHFAADSPGIRVHYFPDPTLDDDGRDGVRARVPGADRYSVLCDAPCDRDLPRTHYVLAFSRGDDPLLRAPDVLTIDGNTQIAVRWEDRSLLRDAGTWTMLIGIPVGVLLGVLPFAIGRAMGGEDEAGVYGTLIAGSVVAAASLVVGIALILHEDGVSFRATPLPDAGSVAQAW